LNNKELNDALTYSKKILKNYAIDSDLLNDKIVSSLIKKSEKICQDVVSFEKKGYNAFDRKLDKILTSKATGYPIMLALLAFIFWLTITGANYPCLILSDGLFWFQEQLTRFFQYMNAPDWLHGILVLGVYRVLAWVVSVMLPPMAIFFPLFTLLEDAGYLPRVAYNLDNTFKRCCACGKQALTMCMGFGCNAAGVVGCRIIDSPRERLLAILTNNFVPCNGRFPTLIAILTMFFIGSTSKIYASILSALLLTGVILLGILVTFGVTKLLSRTLLKGVPSSFTLELPPYRKPQIGTVIIRSIFDRTLFVLGRALMFAAPSGMIIWLMANVTIANTSILNHCAIFLDPFATLMGLDGVILLAFILGLPANEIVIPIIIMAYMSQGSILELGNLTEMKELFIANGWSWITAICTMLFSLMHWPCSTTLMTIKKETASWKWTFLAAAIPTAIGMICCILFASIAKLFV
ncbi:MAG: nucleoside recognition domain-containing protein, partial [Anaerotignum sp.]